MFSARFWAPWARAAIVVVFVLFMLIKREDLRDRIIHLIGRGQLNTTTQALDEAAHKVSGYLFMQVIINVCFGMPVGIGLFFIGVPNAFSVGLLATLLRFIPYIGAWIALGFPLFLSLAVSETWAMPIETLGLFAVIELVTSNVLEPWLYGAHTGLSPVAIMVATIFWTWLWGGVGLLLATPLTVCVAVLGKYIPSLSFLDALLGDEPTLSAEDRFYQRLLASDRREAEAVATRIPGGPHAPGVVLECVGRGALRRPSGRRRREPWRSTASVSSSPTRGRSSRKWGSKRPRIAAAKAAALKKSGEDVPALEAAVAAATGEKKPILPAHGVLPARRRRGGRDRRVHAGPASGAGRVSRRSRCPSRRWPTKW